VKFAFSELEAAFKQHEAEILHLKGVAHAKEEKVQEYEAAMKRQSELNSILAASNSFREKRLDDLNVAVERLNLEDIHCLRERCATFHDRLNDGEIMMR
jgi:hypothetical protein